MSWIIHDELLVHGEYLNCEQSEQLRCFLNKQWRVNYLTYTTECTKVTNSHVSSVSCESFVYKASWHKLYSWTGWSGNAQNTLLEIFGMNISELPGLIEMNLVSYSEWKISFWWKRTSVHGHLNWHTSLVECHVSSLDCNHVNEAFTAQWLHPDFCAPWGWIRIIYCLFNWNNKFVVQLWRYWEIFNCKDQRKVTFLHNEVV